MEAERGGRSVGTGVFMPPSVQAALARGCSSTHSSRGAPPPTQNRRPGAAGADPASPATTPRSCTSRSSSFSSATSSTPAVPGGALGKPCSSIKHPALRAGGGTSSRPHSAAAAQQAGPNRPRTAQQSGAREAALMCPGAAEASSAAPQQARYGRFSLDDSSTRLAVIGAQHAPQVAPRSSMSANATTAAAWAPGTGLCNSLSTPAALDSFGVAQGVVPTPADAALMVQEDSWASTVSGDVCMLHDGSDAAALLVANAERVQAMQRERETQFLLAQQQQQLQLQQLQRQQELQLLQAQLGMLPAAPQQLSADPLSATDASQLQGTSLPGSRRASFGPAMLSAADLAAQLQCISKPGSRRASFGPAMMSAADLAAQLQCISLPGSRRASRGPAMLSAADLAAQLQCISLPGSRRASFGPAMLSAADLAQSGRAASMPVSGGQLPPGAGMWAAAVALADADAAADTAIEAQLNAALQQLLVVRGEVQLKKARAAGASAGSNAVAAAAMAPPSAVMSGGSLAATALYRPSSSSAASDVLASSYQPSSSSAAGGFGPDPCAAQQASVSVSAAPCATFSACAPVVGAASSSGLGPQRLAVSAGAAVFGGGFSGDAAVCPLVQGAPEVSLADFLGLASSAAPGVGAGAGAPVAQAAWQQELLALSQAAGQVGAAPGAQVSGYNLLSQPR